MLILTRRADESIMIGDHIKVTLVSVNGGQVRIGIQAPPEVRVMRTELIDGSRPAKEKRT